MRFFVAMMMLLAAVTAAHAQRSDDAKATAIAPDGGRVVQQGDRLDIFDATGARVGYGQQRSDGSVDVFNVDGSRRATIQKDTGSGARVTTPGKR